MFDWDDAKREANLRRHGLDLAEAQVMFDGRPTVTSASPRGAELRFVTHGPIDSKLHLVVWTMRGGIR